jgi:hypothetical protein
VTAPQAASRGADELRFLLHEHSLVLEPGEVLVVMVPPDWPPLHCRDLQDALNAVIYEHGIPVVVTPGTAVAVGKRVAAVRDVRPAG